MVVFAFTASGFEVGLFKGSAAVREERGHRPEVLAGTGGGGGRRCQLAGLGFISRFSGANIPLNGGEAMSWQGPALALFQLNGIKHRRYARRRIFIGRGAGRRFAL